jgi:uncharacterized protein YndB with AHSA1/START domain
VAKVEVSEELPVDPGAVWGVVSDLSRLGEWLDLHEDWRSEVPADLEVGTELTSVVVVKGMRNRVTWTIEELRPPELIVLAGDGKGGTRVSLRVSATRVEAGTSVELYTEFKNPALIGPIGGAAGRALKGELRRSLDRLAGLAA